MLKKTMKNVRLALISTAMLMISQGLGAKDQGMVGKEWDQCVDWGYYRDILNEKSETKEIDFISRNLMKKRAAYTMQELKSRIRLISGSEKKESEAGVLETSVLPDSGWRKFAREIEVSEKKQKKNEETKEKIDDFFSKLGYEEESKKFSIDGDKEPLEVAKDIVRRDVEMWRSVMGCLMSEADVSQYIRGGGDLVNNLDNVSYEWYKKQPEGFKLAWVRAAIETTRIQSNIDIDKIKEEKERAEDFLHGTMMSSKSEEEFRLAAKHLIHFCKVLFFVGGLKKEQTPDNEVQNIKKIEEWVDENFLKGEGAISVDCRLRLVDFLKNCVLKDTGLRMDKMMKCAVFLRHLQLHPNGPCLEHCAEKIEQLEKGRKANQAFKERQKVREERLRRAREKRQKTREERRRAREERWRAGQKKSPKKPKGKRRKSNRRLTKYTKKYKKTKKMKRSRNRR